MIVTWYKPQVKAAGTPKIGRPLHRLRRIIGKISTSKRGRKRASTPTSSVGPSHRM